MEAVQVPTYCIQCSKRTRRY